MFIIKLTIISIAGWAEWGGWSECSCNCGKVGTQARTRACGGGAEIGSEYCPCNGNPTLSHISDTSGNDRCDFNGNCNGVYGSGTE